MFPMTVGAEEQKIFRSVDFYQWCRRIKVFDAFDMTDFNVFFIPTPDT